MKGGKSIREGTLRKRGYLREIYGPGPKEQKSSVKFGPKAMAAIARSVKGGNYKAIKRIHHLLVRAGQNYGQIYSIFKKAVPGLKMRDFEALMQEIDQEFV